EPAPRRWPAGCWVAPDDLLAGVHQEQAIVAAVGDQQVAIKGTMIRPRSRRSSARVAPAGADDQRQRPDDQNRGEKPQAAPSTATGPFASAPASQAVRSFGQPRQPGQLT